MEWGEGTKDCLKRELHEELGLTAEIGDLFYVNDFAQLSAFRKNDQLFSFYFLVEQIDFNTIQAINHDFPLTEEGPPFGGSLQHYTDLFEPYFHVNVLERSYNSIKRF